MIESKAAPKQFIHLHLDDDPFARVRKAMLNDPALSWKAKGILAYLLGKPDDWQVITKDIVNQSRDGARGVRAGLRELVNAGYMCREVVRNSGTIVKHVWHVSDRADFLANSPRCCFAQMPNAQVRNGTPTKNEVTENDGTEKTLRETPAVAGARSMGTRKLRWKNSKRWKVTPQWLRSFEAAFPDDYALLAEYGKIDAWIANGWRDPKGGFIQNHQKYLLATAEKMRNDHPGFQ